MLPKNLSPNQNEKNNKDNQQKDRQQRQMANRRGCGLWTTLIWLIVGIVIPIIWFSSIGQPQGTQISYSEFRAQVQEGNVPEVTIRGEEISGQFSETVELQREEETIELDQFVTYVPSFGDDRLLALLETENVIVNTEPTSDNNWLGILINFLPFLLLIGIMFFIFRSMRGQGKDILSLGKSGAKLYDRRKEGTTFEDVAGAKGAKGELQEIIGFLKNPEKFERLGGEVPKGVLLVGPPGTGKTLLAKAVAGEADVPFLSITGSNFMEMFVGVGASRVRDLFKDAKKSSPSIIFIDELDSIGRRRGAGLGGGHDEREQTLNQLLNEMDGFEPNEGVIVIAATNRPDILDQALLRPGRFDRRITVDLPTMKDREEILKIHSRNKPIADDVDLERLARGTPGFSGADLENLLNEAALIAARNEKGQIEKDDIEQARDKILLGLERETMALTDEDCKLLAYHEGGHAVVAAVLPNADPIHKVTIVPRGRAMGVTQQLPERDKYIYKKEYVLDRIAVMMGGRAAEELVFDSMTSGAENDLQQATELARRMVLNWGMAKRFKQISYGSRQDHVFLGKEIADRRDYSEETARELDQEIFNILKEAYDRAKSVLEDKREKLDELADALVDREEIPGEEVIKMVMGNSAGDETRQNEEA